MAELPEKAPGAWYAVVLRAPGYSAGHTAATAATLGTSDFPAPDLGKLCVCCDRETASAVDFDPSTDRFKITPIRMPVCDDCKGHVAEDTVVARILGALLILAGGGLVYAGANGLHAVAAGCLVAAFALVLWISGRRRKRNAMAASGHKNGLEIGAHPRQCAVRTTNRRLAQELVSRHAPLVHRAF
jgi:uncharacterized protein YlaI